MRMKVGILSAVGVALAASSALAQVGPVFNSTPGTFMDISTTGVSVFGSGTGDIPVDVTTTIGNRVYNAGTVRVWENGALAFNFGALNPGLSAIPATIPAGNGTPTGLLPGVKYLLPYWDDLDLRPPVGLPDPGRRGVFFQQIGDLAIFQWNNIGNFPGGGNVDDRATFQVQIPRGGTTNLMMQIIYQSGMNLPDFMGGNTACIGYVAGNPGPNNGANSLWGFNAVPNGVQNGTVLSQTPAPGAAALLGLGALAACRRRRA
jgi:MYXO-CTERM domain-containing protein